MRAPINWLELTKDIEDVRKSADRVYAESAGNDFTKRTQAMARHQVVLDAFVAKYGSLHVKPM